MKDLKTEVKVLDIVSKISGKRITGINPNGAIKDELSLDSIQIVELFATLEIEFGIELPLRMMTVKSGKEFLEILDVELSNKIVCPV